MSRDWRLFLDEMRAEVRHVQEFVGAREQAAFFSDVMAVYATARSLAILGEAAKKVPVEVQDRNPEVDWKGIAGLRDVIVHQYFAVEQPVLWSIIITDLPRLLEKLDRIAETGK